MPVALSPSSRKFGLFCRADRRTEEEEERVGRRRDAEISLAFPFPDDAAGAGRMSTETTSSRRNAFSTKMKTQGATMITSPDYYQQRCAGTKNVHSVIMRFAAF